VTVTAPANATPLPTETPLVLAVDTTRTASGSADTTAETVATVPTDVTELPPTDGSTATVPAGQIPQLTDTNGAGPLPGALDGPAIEGPSSDEPSAPTLPVSPTTIAPMPTIGPLLPAVTVPVTVPLPLVPVDAGVELSGDGLAVDANVGLPAGLGGLGADVAAGGPGRRQPPVDAARPTLSDAAGRSRRDARPFPANRR
jgi:hypothetical protein